MGGDKRTIPPGPGGAVDAAINANNMINKDYQEPPHPPGLVAICRRSGQSQT